MPMKRFMPILELMSLSWLLPILLFLLLPFLVVYILGYVRAARTGERDPLLGAKVLTTCLITVAFQIFLVGTAMFLGRSFEGQVGQAMKTPLGLMLGGLLAAAYPAIAYFVRIRRHGTQEAARQALGINAIFAGIVFAVAVTVWMVMQFNDAREIEWPAAFTLTYFAASLICGVPVLSDPNVKHDRP